jgi:Na+-driven multidrug efflux pump
LKPLEVIIQFYLNLISENDVVGLTGLWLAMSFAWFLSTIVYLAVVLKTDWSEQTIVKKAVKNTEANPN